YRQWRYLDAFIDQRPRFLRRCLAVDRAMLDIAVVHLARLGGKALADIVRVTDDVIAQFLQFRAQLPLLRHHEPRRAGGRRFGRRWCLRRRRRRICLFTSPLADDPRGHDGLLDVDRVADRTAYKLALDLRLVGRGALEPTLERMIVFAAKRVADHADPRTRCR